MDDTLDMRSIGGAHGTQCDNAQVLLQRGLRQRMRPWLRACCAADKCWYMYVWTGHCPRWPDQRTCHPPLQHGLLRVRHRWWGTQLWPLHAPACQRSHARFALLFSTIKPKRQHIASQLLPSCCCCGRHGPAGRVGAQHHYTAPSALNGWESQGVASRSTFKLGRILHHG